ncbi:MAG: 2-amino-4-hydroxy-6-hydroxymethyldihydropteridine diphosphokinase [Lentisphaerae bacterium GWF2_45_14]|nr:MAG: 2-amino-4-hydroxy-6-hydroxymethyldihydropteridine diphosphokinase [Lentisphaerae bacterium GWF2_45_14]
MTIDLSEKQRIAIAIGANTGDISANFRITLKELEAGGVGNIRTSKFYRTAPVDCPPDSQDFINGALIGTWGGSPEKLLELCKNIEEAAGRPSIHEKSSSRPLDLDIIFFGNKIHRSENLTIPHKEAAKRLFVLVPLADVAGGWLFPGKNLSVKNILDNLASADRSAYISIISSVVTLE